MRIEVYSRHGEIGFVVHAENATDRAILNLVTSEHYTRDRRLVMGGCTWSCDVSGTTDFNFGWIREEKPTPVSPTESK